MSKKFHMSKKRKKTPSYDPSTLSDEEREFMEKKNKKNYGKEIAIGVFSVLMALSMMIPSLSQIIMASTHKDKQQTLTVNKVDDAYKANIEKLEAEIKKDPKNAKLQKELADSYLNWANLVNALGKTPEEKKNVADLREKGIAAYQEAVKLDESAANVGGLSMAMLVVDKKDEGLKLMTDYVEKHKDDAEAYVKLGMDYEYLQQFDKAKEAYEQAVKADPTGEHKQKAIAEGRLAQIKSIMQESANKSDSSKDSSNDTSGSK